MKYATIKLVGYLRMRLNDVTHFEMTMRSALQLILGTNGSGKSSLLWELSPLPANPADYAPGGSKTVELEHNGQHYRLISSFEGKQQHFFFHNGVDLNPSHLVTVQKELVKTHFKITSDVQELISGKERFVHMSTARRKDWFMRLCDVNYDYALNVFGQLKAAHRDRAGAIRLEKRAMVTESEKLLSDQDIAKLNEEAQWLHECLSYLLEHRKPLESDLTTLEIEGAQIDKQLTNLANQFSELSQKVLDREHSDAELNDLINETAATVVAAQTRVSMLAEQHEKLDQKITVLQKAGENTIASLEVKIARGRRDHDSDLAKTLLGRRIEQPERAMAAFESVKSPLVGIFTTIPNNASKMYSQVELTKAREQLDTLNRVKTNLLESIAEKRASLTHMSDHMGKPDVTCPKCAHSFSLIYSEERMIALKEAVAALSDRLATEVYPAIGEAELYIEECSNYASLFRQFHHLTVGSALLNPYWAWLQERKVLSDTPMQGPSDLERIESDLRLQILLAQVDKELQEMQTNLQDLRTVGDADIHELKAQAEQLDEELSQHTQQLQIAQTQNAYYRSQAALRTQALSVRRGMRKAIYAHRDLLKNKVEHQRRTILNQLIRDLQSALASREHQLHIARRQKDVVEAMANKIKRLGEEEQAFAILLKELSPTEGLIAEGMLGFIKNFCDQMNQLIEQVWSYPLIIKSCEMEGESLDLDYRFPLVQGVKAHPVADVSQGSEGMQDIVDLAFRLVAMQYLGLEDFPLYLDEMGKTFDKAHRSAAANMVRSLLEQATFPQVFMISHYEGMYGALADPEICVLNPTNIVVPREHNQHVKMH